MFDQVWVRKVRWDSEGHGVSAFSEGRSHLSGSAGGTRSRVEPLAKAAGWECFFRCANKCHLLAECGGSSWEGVEQLRGFVLCPVLF